MNKYLVSINDLPPDGKDFDLGEQGIWLEPLREFKMDCRIVEPIQAKIHVQAADQGCLVRGKIQGAVILPCNRCAEDAKVELNNRFDEFETIPAEEGSPQARDGDLVEHEALIVFEKHSPMLDLAAVCWEQFMLALPVSPLCREECKGLCPKCGLNLNLGSCSCQDDAADPRLAALRGLNIPRQ